MSCTLQPKDLNSLSVLYCTKWHGKRTQAYSTKTFVTISTLLNRRYTRKNTTPASCSSLKQLVLRQICLSLKLRAGFLLLTPNAFVCLVRNIRRHIPFLTRIIRSITIATLKNFQKKLLRYSKKMLNALKKCLKNEKRDKTLFDAILFGSAVKGRYK